MWHTGLQNYNATNRPILLDVAMKEFIFILLVSLHAKMFYVKGVHEGRTTNMHFKNVLIRQRDQTDAEVSPLLNSK